jgi:hypothetical protein
MRLTKLDTPAQKHSQSVEVGTSTAKTMTFVPEGEIDGEELLVG